MITDTTEVPVGLNIVFNNHFELIVNPSTEALKDFFGMELDVLAIEDQVVTK